MPDNKHQLSRKAQQNREIILSIRSRMLRGELTHDQAKAEAMPTIDAMNETAKVLAKEYKMRYKPLTFSNLMR